MESTSPGGYDGFLRQLTLTVVFFVFTPVVILTSLFSLISLGSPPLNIKANPKVLSASIQGTEIKKSGVSVYASLPSSLPAISNSVEGDDARPEILRQYLDYYNSPLEPYSELLVQTADRYLLDYRLLAAIAQQESNLCKIIPPGSHNCWGWGIHSKGSLGFNSFEEAIETVSKGIREEYVNKGYISVEEIMSKYTPLSDGSWAYGVNKFMIEMEEPF